MISITPLFSGSKGNCTLIRSNTCNVLLDAGYGYKAICAALSKVGISIGKIDAVVVTHEHSDHVGALGLVAKHSGATVFAPAAIAGYLCQRALCPVVPVGGAFSIGDISVDTYVCSHDAMCCFGYKFTCGGQSVASVTDTGCWGTPLVEFLRGCHTVMIESNHDVEMLCRGDYPAQLKRRIMSDYGHLNNAQTAQIAIQAVQNGTKNIILAHLSEQNNTAEIAFATTVKALAHHGIVEGRDANVFVAAQRDNEVTL